MSFLNSVLNSIDGGSAPVEAPEVRRLTSASKLRETKSATSGGKRKAEDDLKGPDEKISKLSTKLDVKASPTDIKNSKTNQPLKNKAAEPTSTYKGTSRPDASITSSAPSKGVPPKKGSFAEILARAKQNQGPPVGTITHKAKEKVSAKKEIALEKELAKKNIGKPAQTKGGLHKKTSELAIRKAGPEARATEKNAKPGGYQGTSRPTNRPQSATAYQGTAKGKPGPTYKGTMKSSKAAPPKRAYHSDSEPSRSKLQSSSKHRRKEEYSDEDSEGYDSEDKYTYASEDFSDMDAGFDDLEEEDEAAERLARQEDAKEQAQLEKLKREKEKKKALLQGKAKGRN